MFLKGIKAALPNSAHKEFDLDSEKNERLPGTVENMDLGIRQSVSSNPNFSQAV